jgi:hypothetical protein
VCLIKHWNFQIKFDFYNSYDFRIKSKTFVHVHGPQFQYLDAHMHGILFPNVKKKKFKLCYCSFRFFWMVFAHSQILTNRLTNSIFSVSLHDHDFTWHSCIYTRNAKLRWIAFHFTLICRLFNTRIASESNSFFVSLLRNYFSWWLELRR